MRQIVYTEHLAGSFEDGLQICTLCGKVLLDYTGDWVGSDGSKPSGFPEGYLYVTGVNPVTTMIDKPLENYGGGDPYSRVVVKCVKV